MNPKVFSAALAAMLVSAPAGHADDPPPFPDFTFRMEKPPAPGIQRRITVQITPEPGDTAARPDATDAPAPARHGWFWSGLATGLDVDPARRLRRAMDSLEAPPEGARVPVPRLQEVQDIAAREGRHILRATIGTRVSPALVLAVIAVESGGRRGATSARGAGG